MREPAVGTPIVRCRGLGRRYGGTQALVALDLTLSAGPPIALVGPNGAGKTTLLSLLAGYVRPSAGEAEVFGERAGSPALAGRLAAVPQDALFDPRLAIGRQLAGLARLQGFGRAAAGTEAARVLEVVGLGDVGTHRPTALSHGMRKRVALAQALIGEPELVLLDEPTAGIDPENARAIRELIVGRDATATFVVSSHNLDELERLCGSVIQLERGELVLHESLADLGARDDLSPATASASVGNPVGASGTSPGTSPIASPGTNRGTNLAASPVTNPGRAGSRGIVRPELTLRLGEVPEAAFVEAAGALPGVSALRRLPDGDWRVTVTDESAAASALLGLLGERGWSWRHVVRGRSLEERLYGAD